MCILPPSPQDDSTHYHVVSRLGYIQELRQQLKTSGPAMLSMLLNKIPWLISLRFVGNMGSNALAAAALATTLCNVTGMSLSIGFSSAMSTLTGQARGDWLSRNQSQRQFATTNDNRAQKESEEKAPFLSENESFASQQPLLPLMYLYRGMFIQLVLIIPVGCWWLHGIKPLLVALGQGEILSEMTQDYIRILTIALWAYSTNWTITSWLQAIEMADVPGYTAMVGLVFHIPFNILFIHFMGYLGVAMATAAFQVVQLLSVTVYLVGTSAGVSRVLKQCGAHASITKIPFRREATLALSIPGILQYLSLAIPGIVIISEWWASEVSIFLSGTLMPNPNLALDGMTIYQSINTFCFMFPVGCSVAGSTRVGAFLGSGNAHGAAMAAKVSVMSASVLSATMGLILFWTPHSFFPSFFSPDNEVVDEASQLIPLLAIYVFGDGIQSACNGVIKGCGRQCIVMPIVVFAYWIVGVPLAYYISFTLHNGVMCEDSYFCGVRGLVTGMTTATFVHMLLLALVVLCTTNWNLEAKRAKERLSVDDHEGDQEMTSTLNIPDVRDEGVL